MGQATKRPVRRQAVLRDNGQGQATGHLGLQKLSFGDSLGQTTKQDIWTSQAVPGTTVQATKTLAGQVGIPEAVPQGQQDGATNKQDILARPRDCA
ncbi:hypothetical protein AVEN_242193-1 [Araneus ventricosus]|uniref:Uncharacterized protein n=1 Tax=Araneus ventricosus TaxID=182803 RepID=A0A4Y2QZ35_ARAVE|nr:hypothetical protein AVEN_242193-1 [Araneus ventricosus]